MAQRVALARALVNDPKLLLLDEPLGKLDSLTRHHHADRARGLWQRAGFTALLVTHDVEEALFLANRVIVFSDRPARIMADIAVDLPYPRHRGDPCLAELRRNPGITRIGCDMVTRQAFQGARRPGRCEPAFLRAPSRWRRFAARAAKHDRDGSFPFENFEELFEAGLLSLTVPAALGGQGAGARETARVLSIIGKADPSTALVLSMHYIQHL